MADTIYQKVFFKILNDDEYTIKRYIDYEQSLTDINFLYYSNTVSSAAEANVTPAGSSDYCYFMIYNTGSFTIDVGTATGVYKFYIPPGGIFVGSCESGTTLYYKASGGDSEAEFCFAQFDS